MKHRLLAALIRIGDAPCGAPCASFATDNSGAHDNPWDALRAQISLLGVLLLSVLLSCAPICAQGTISQVADLNTGPNSGPSGSMLIDSSAVFFDGRTFYSAQTTQTGNELWVTDGTALNTRLFADICAGRCGSSPRSFYIEGNSLYFSADDGVHGSELWRLAAGAAAPVLLSDINPGAEGSDPKLFERVSFRAAASTVTRTFFTATRAAEGRELWRLNAATNSVALELDLAPGPASSNPAGFTSLNTFQVGLTAVTPNLRRDVYALEYASTTLPPTGATLLTAFASTSTRTAFPELVTLASNTYVIIGVDSGLDELWVTQGTNATSVRLRTADGFEQLVFNVPLFRTFFVTRSGSVRSLNVTDGSVAGTLSLGAFDPLLLTAVGNRMLFTGNTPSSGRELFSSDGTVAGTGLLKELVSGSGGIPTSGFDVFRATTVQPARLLLGFGNQLWLSDASSAGTILITGGALSGAGNLRGVFPTTALEALLSIDPSVGFSGGEPFYNRGSAGSNVALGNFFSDVGDSNPQPKVAINGRLILNVFSPIFRTLAVTLTGTFVSEVLPSSVNSPSGSHFGRIWSRDLNGLFTTDGTIVGSNLVTNVRPEIRGPDCVIARNGTEYFIGQGIGALSTTGVEIFRSDGTEAGTAAVTDLSAVGAPQVFEVCDPGFRLIAGMGSQLFFVAETNNSGLELYALNATDQVSLVADIRSGAQSSDISDFLALTDRLLMSANDGVFGQELWVSNGTGQGTLRLTDIAPGAASSSPSDMTRVGNQIFFTAFDPASGRELYVSDGTQAGTRRVIDLFAGIGSAFFYAPDFKVTGNKLIFRATGSGQPSCRLYETDGTAAGTRCAYDSAVNVLGPVNEIVATAGGAVVFTASDASDGEELRALFNRQLLNLSGGDIAPGAGGSGPRSLLADGNTVYFQADDGTSGVELWRLVLGDLDSLFRSGFE